MAAVALNETPRLCPRCGRLAKPPYYYHYACRNLDVAERRKRILSLPEKPVTLEVWCRMWGMTLKEGRESYENWKRHD